MTTDLRLINCSSRPIAVVRRIARPHELSTIVPPLCGTVWNALKADHAKGGRCLAVYLDDRISVEVGVELESPWSSNGEVIASALPSGKAATATHFGAYGTLDETHQAIIGWCKNQNLERAGVTWEIYGHWQNEWNQNPSLIQTDVFHLLKEHP